MSATRAGGTEAAALERAYRHAERVTAAWARSFYFASRFLPAGKRRAVFALYDFCRHADNLVDARGARPAAAVRAELRALGRMVRRLRAGEDAGGQRWLALGDTLRRYPVPEEPLLDLLDGVTLDLGPVELPDFAALARYCRLVAGGVGLMLGPVLGAPPDVFSEPGVRLGVAMQLTNVLRDVGEDAASGRVYLAREDLKRFGVGEEMLRADPAPDELRLLLACYAERARIFYERAAALRPAEDRARLRPADAMGAIYRALLDRLQQQRFPQRERAVRLSNSRR
ncbi:MAG: phytoene/squalene synthase family protein, partial [Deltaproteobacteria bacterium]